MAETRLLHGACHCRAVNFTFTLPADCLPLSAHMCHCSICRWTHGTLCTFHAQLPAGTRPNFISPSTPDNLVGFIHERASSERLFCRACGCHVGDTGLHDGGDWCVGTSIFEEQDAFVLKTHVFTKAAGGSGLYEILTKIGDRELGTWNPKSSDEQGPAPISRHNTSESITVQCFCGGVSLALARPTQQHRQDERLKELMSPIDSRKWVAHLDVGNDCRTLDGVPATAWLDVPLDAFYPALPQSLIIGKAKSYQPHEHLTRRFCSVCGATVFQTSTKRQAGIVGLAVGLLRSSKGALAEDILTWDTKLEKAEEAEHDFRIALTEGVKEWKREQEEVLAN